MAGEELTGQISSWVNTIISWGLWFVIGLVVLIALGSIGIWFFKKKKWNLRVEIKMPRSDGLIVNSEKGKGHYGVKVGLVSIKRKGLKASEMKPFDVKKYLQGSNFLEVIQVGPDDYLPVLPKSYITLTDKEIGKKCAVLDVESDLGERRQWAFHAAKNALNRFSLAGFLDKHAWAIQLAIILFAVFIGFAALWSKVD